MGAGPPEGNTNAEKWTFENSEELFNQALELSKQKNGDVYKYDFIGELARDLDQYKEIFTYLSGKFKELQRVHNQIISNCEANCFHNGKKSNIVPSMAIMNLKSNHGWTDRVANDHSGEIGGINNIVFSDKEQKELDDLLTKAKEELNDLLNEAKEE